MNAGGLSPKRAMKLDDFVTLYAIAQLKALKIAHAQHKRPFGGFKHYMNGAVEALSILGSSAADGYGVSHEDFMQLVKRRSNELMPAVMGDMMKKSAQGFVQTPDGRWWTPDGEKFWDGQQWQPRP